MSLKVQPEQNGQLVVRVKKYSVVRLKKKMC